MTRKDARAIVARSCELIRNSQKNFKKYHAHDIEHWTEVIESHKRVIRAMRSLKGLKNET